MCGKDAQATSSTAATASCNATTSEPRKLRPIAQLRCDYWKRQTQKLADERSDANENSLQEDSSRQLASCDDQPCLSSRADVFLETPVKSKLRSLEDLTQKFQQRQAPQETPVRPKLRSLEDLTQKFQQRQAPQAQQRCADAPTSRSLHRYDRSSLLISRQLLLQQNMQPLGGLGIRCVAVPTARSAAKPTRNAEDPLSNNDILLQQMKERPSRWNFKAVVNADENLWSASTKEFEGCGSTAAGSRLLSECPSSNSESSTPRAAPEYAQASVEAHVLPRQGI